MHARKQVEKLPRSYLRFMTVEMDRFRAHIDRIYEEKAVYDEGLAEGLAKGIAEGSAKTDKKWQDVIAEREAEIADKDAEIAERDAEIADHKAEIAERDAEIARLRAQLPKNN